MFGGMYSTRRGDKRNNLLQIIYLAKLIHPQRALFAVSIEKSNFRSVCLLQNDLEQFVCPHHYRTCRGDLDDTRADTSK